MKKIVVNCSTKESVEVDMSIEEINELKTTQAAVQNAIKLEQEKEQSRIALFERLGISQEEAKILLG